jgi:hypothetical protein
MLKGAFAAIESDSTQHQRATAAQLSATLFIVD